MSNEVALRSTRRLDVWLATHALVLALACGGPAEEPDAGTDGSALLACPAPETIQAGGACTAPTAVSCNGSREPTCDGTQLAWVPCTCTDGRWDCAFRTCPGESTCPDLFDPCTTGARCRGPFACPDGIELLRTCECFSGIWSCVSSECP